jgi:hypothetical protein
MFPKLGVAIVLLEVMVLVLFGVFVRYDEMVGMPKEIPGNGAVAVEEAKQEETARVAHRQDEMSNDRPGAAAWKSPLKRKRRTHTSPSSMQCSRTST